MDNFTDEEIRSQLQQLGYENLSPNRFKNFRDDLTQYIAEKQSVSFNDESSSNDGRLDHSWNESVSYEFHSPKTLDFQTSFENGKSFEDNTHIDDDNEIFDGNSSNNSSTYSIRPTHQLQSNVRRRLDSSITSKKYEKEQNRNDNNKNMMELKSKYSFDDDSILSDTTIDDQILQINNHRKNRRNSRSATNPTGRYMNHHKSATSLSTADEDFSQFNNNNDYGNQQSCIILRPVSGRRCPGTNTKRQDPVTRYQNYAECWKQYPLIGTEKHSKLRWNVKNHLNQQRQKHLDYLKRTDKRTYSAKAGGLCEKLPRKTRQLAMPPIRLNV